MGHGSFSDRGQYHFLNLNFDIGTPPTRAPIQTSQDQVFPTLKALCLWATTALEAFLQDDLLPLNPLSRKQQHALASAKIYIINSKSEDVLVLQMRVGETSLDYILISSLLFVWSLVLPG